MVEGQSGDSLGQYSFDYRISVFQYRGRGNPHSLDARLGQPFVAGLIALRPITAIMCFSVDFDRQPGVTAEKVEHVRTGRMLPS
jgi:hypothetical protein